MLDVFIFSNLYINYYGYAIYNFSITSSKFYFNYEENLL